MMTRTKLVLDYVKTTCKIGQGNACCRYLTMAPDGWDCEKHTELAAILDARVAAKTIVAQSDNCEGVVHERS